MLTPLLKKKEKRNTTRNKDKSINAVYLNQVLFKNECVFFINQKYTQEFKEFYKKKRNIQCPCVQHKGGFCAIELVRLFTNPCSLKY